MPNRPAVSPDDSRFWSRVDKGDGTGCWLWTGRLDRGYGIFAHMPAHRWLFKVMGRELLEGQHVGHRCHDEALVAGVCGGGVSCKHRACVRPDHMEAQSPRANHLSGAGAAGVNGRKEVAACGHPFTGIRPTTGWRYCVPCAALIRLEKMRVLGRAAAAIGMKQRDYLKMHGYSIDKARQFIGAS